MNGKTLVALVIACAFALVAPGCQEMAPPQQTAADKDRFLRAQLVGRWDRPWDFGPVVYERVLGADGSLVMREMRRAPASATMPANPGGPGPSSSTDHPKYPGQYTVAQQLSGTWRVDDGRVVYQVTLASGDQLTMQYDVERITANELVESSTGVDGKSELRFHRKR